MCITKSNESICDKCDKQFSSKSHFLLHYRSKHRLMQQYTLSTTIATKKCVCNDCGSIFVSKHSLNAHIKYVHNKKKDVVCDICEKFYPRNDYRQHYRRMHIRSEKEYKCQLCDDKSYANAISLNVHIRIIHNRKYFYKCDECEKTTKTANELFGHISYRHRQSSIRLFDCEKCGKSFKSMSNMNRHIDSFHSNNPNKCQCNKCGKYYKSIELIALSSTKNSFDTTISMRSMRANYQISIGLRSTYSKMRQQRIENKHQWLLRSLTKLS